MSNNNLLLEGTQKAPTKLPFCSLFPSGLQLEWNTESRVLSLISTREPHILKQQIFTKNEWLFLMILIECYPHYAPHEMLLAQITLIPYDDWHQRLEKIRLLQPEAIVRELKPMYRTLSNVRIKLKKVCPSLKILLVRNTGYIFALVPEREC